MDKNSKDKDKKGSKSGESVNANVGSNDNNTRKAQPSNQGNRKGSK